MSKNISLELYLAIQEVLGMWTAYIDTLEDRDKTETSLELIERYKRLVKELKELVDLK